nr:hypothetical protein [Chitinophaga pinensis]
MHAHTKTSTYAEKTAEAESEIARYSTIDVQDFKTVLLIKNGSDRPITK